MELERSKRLGKILENANQYEAAQQRRSKLSSMLWGLLVILILIGMFFAGRVWYSQPQAAPAPAPPQPEAAAPAAARETTAQAPTPLPEPTVEASLPREVHLTAPAELQVRSEGKVVGVIYLKAGETVQPVRRDGGKLDVMWKNAEGTVLVSQTTLRK